MIDNFHRFIAALPKRQPELVDGRMLMAGNINKSAMVLSYLVESLGAEYVAELIPESLLLRTLEKVYGNAARPSPALADFEETSLSAYQVHKLATDIKMSLFAKKADVWGGMMVKLGDNAFMPDVFLLTNERSHLLKQYYMDGPPDLVICIAHPETRAFDFRSRLQYYAQAGVPEVRMMDYEKRSFEPLHLKDGQYAKVPVEGEVFEATTITGLTVQHQRLYESAEEMGISIIDMFEVPDQLIRPSRPVGRHRDEELGMGSVPFKPRLALEPVAIRFEEFISWGGEVKFEYWDEQPIFGGGKNTTREWLGLLLMSLGVEEAVKYVPREEWERVV